MKSDDDQERPFHNSNRLPNPCSPCSPLPIFSIGNLVVHGLPCVVAVYYPPKYLNLYSGIGAVIAQVTWGLAQTIDNKAGLFVLDEVYAPCPKKTWWSLWIVALVVNLLYPFIGPTAAVANPI